MVKTDAFYFQHWKTSKKSYVLLENALNLLKKELGERRVLEYLGGAKIYEKEHPAFRMAFDLPLNEGGLPWVPPTPLYVADRIEEFRKAVQLNRPELIESMKNDLSKLPTIIAKAGKR